MTGNQIQKTQSDAAWAMLNQILDPGNAGQINFDHMFNGVVELATSGTGNETRKLPIPDNVPLGAQLTAIFKSRDGGGTPNITLTQVHNDGSSANFNFSGNTNAALGAPNAWIKLELMTHGGTSKSWRIISSDSVTLS